MGDRNVLHKTVHETFLHLILPTYTTDIILEVINTY